MTTTIDTITDEQIEALRVEAVSAGDFVQAAICDIALSGYPADDVRYHLSRSEKDGIDVLCPTQGSARSECARIIADAEAQQD